MVTSKELKEKLRKEKTAILVSVPNASIAEKVLNEISLRGTFYMPGSIHPYDRTDYAQKINRRLGEGTVHVTIDGNLRTSSNASDLLEELIDGSSHEISVLATTTNKATSSTLGRYGGIFTHVYRTTDGKRFTPA